LSPVLSARSAIAAVPPSQGRRGSGDICGFDATATIIRLGRIHLLEVHLSVAESAGSDRSLTAPGNLGRVGSLARAPPAWFGGDWLDALDKIDLSALYKANRKAAARRGYCGNSV